MNVAVTNILDAARSTGRSNLTAVEAGDICRAYDLPLPAERLATTAAEAAAAAEEVGFPVALKVVSSACSSRHRSYEPSKDWMWLSGQ